MDWADQGQEKGREQLAENPSTTAVHIQVICGRLFAHEIIREQANEGNKDPDLDSAAEEILRRTWFQLPMNQVADTINATTEGYDDNLCFCKEELDGTSVVECSNVTCKDRWFHMDCVMVTDGEEETDWFCSKECTESGNGQFCICRSTDGGILKWTCSNSSCEKGKSFHHSCVRSTTISQG
ncbi:uncharacterized protein LOC135155153 [Lytechinus pictus]|uniref:uncharacterized protein LOC135155153 n=1 Tax=Lytechinus pictus TaxID=7653 RepID=UPI0030BA14E5